MTAVLDRSLDLDAPAPAVSAQAAQPHLGRVRRRPGRDDHEHPDSTIVNVAAPSIQRDLTMSTSALEWIAAAYTLSIAVGLLTGGRLGDMFGRRRMMLIGLSGFVLASAAVRVRVVARIADRRPVLQGLSAAVLTPQSFGLNPRHLPPAQMGKAFAALGPVIGLSTVAGPVVAGLLIKVDLFGTDWRALFLINLRSACSP